MIRLFHNVIRNTQHLALGTLLAFLFFITPTISFGFERCECGRPEEFDRMVVRSFAIFTGRVARVVRELDPDRQRVEFTVYQSWKGVRYPAVTVYTAGTDLVALAREGLTCGYRFRVGEEYLIFSFRDGDNRGPSHVSRCGGIYPIDQAGPVLNYLGDPQQAFTSMDVIRHKAQLDNPSTVREANQKTEAQTAPNATPLPDTSPISAFDQHQKLSSTPAEPVLAPARGGVNEVVDFNALTGGEGAVPESIPESPAEENQSQENILMPEGGAAQPNAVINNVPIY